MIAIKLTRVRPGYYRTGDGLWEIVRGDTGCGWCGMWVFRETRHGGTYSDPVATLGEAREQLGAAIAARRGGAESPPAVALRRLAPGLYETLDSAWQIERGGADTSFRGLWMVWPVTLQSARLGDPVPTLAAAKRELAARFAASNAGPKAARH